MSIDTLVKAVNECLERDRRLIGLHADDSNRDRLRAEVGAAARALESELRAYAEERSRPGTVRSILVAVDDSEPARWALDEAVRLAESLDARVSLVHVIDVAPVLAAEFTFDDARNRPALVQAARELLRGLAARVPAERLGEQILREGNAEKQIVAAAQDSCADLLVIGTHAHGLLGRVLLGSVAEAVVRHSICPVVTVGHPGQGTTPEPHAVEMFF